MSNTVSTTERPKIGGITATNIVIANIIGTGVFTSLGFQAIEIKSGFALLLLWAIGGVFALCGALCYGELGAAMPRSGGEYHYLSEIYHPAIGFLSGWVSVTVGFAAPIALSAMAFGKYAAQLIPGVPPMLLAVLITITISLIHTQNLQLGSYFQNATTNLKTAVIVIFILAGLVLATPQSLSFTPTIADLSTIVSTPFAVSLVYVTYAYSGWNAAIYLAGEIDQPARNLPRTLLVGTAIVTVLYLALNFVFLHSTPIDDLAGELEVGYIAATNIFGAVGSTVMGGAISFGLVSSISSMVWAGPRVTQTIGEDFPLFAKLAQTNRAGIPYRAIVVQLAIALALIISSTFEAVLTYLSFTLTLSSFVTVLGLFVDRYRHPGRPRPYQTWGYPVVPLLFLLMSLWILLFVLRGNPIESGIGLVTVAIGLLVYRFARRAGKVAS
ncbi:MAG: amino acid permease [Coleofasciculaceae cyanobacterium RL_1_1]|nr:amino acid permease [Coleofasciculaceae cyanobacterium RL_1_1]